MTEIDIADIQEGDTVTVEFSGHGGYTTTGLVWNINNDSSRSKTLAVGGSLIRNGKIVNHNPIDPKWWSWRLIRYDGHVYALSDTSTNIRFRFHFHIPSYCGCTEDLPAILHNNSSRTMPVTRMRFETMLW